MTHIITRLIRRCSLAAAIALPLALMPASSALATGIPVIDVSSIANQLIELGYTVEQIEQFTTQIQNQVEQIQKAQQQIDAVTGIRDLGDLLNSPLYRQNRQYLPDELTSAAAFANGNTDARFGALSNAITSAREANRIATQADYGTGDVDYTNSQAFQLHESRALDIEQQSQYARASYQRTTTKPAEYQQLIDKINTTTDLKSSIDLNTRVVAESLLAQNEIIRQLALAQEQQASAERAVITAQEARAKANAGRRVSTIVYAGDRE